MPQRAAVPPAGLEPASAALVCVSKNRTRLYYKEVSYTWLMYENMKKVE